MTSNWPALDQSDEALRARARRDLEGKTIPVWHYTGLRLWEDVISHEGLIPYEIEFSLGSTPKTALVRDIRPWRPDGQAIWCWPGSDIDDRTLTSFHIFHRSTGRSAAGVLLYSEVPAHHCFVQLITQYLRLKEGPASAYNLWHTQGRDDGISGDIDHKVLAECVLEPIPASSIRLEAVIDIQIQRVARAHADTAIATDGLRVEVNGRRVGRRRQDPL